MKRIKASGLLHDKAALIGRRKGIQQVNPLNYVKNLPLPDRLYGLTR